MKKVESHAQVKIHKLLMESRFRTLNKNEADFFFVPAYVKCVRISSKGLTEQEVNEYFLKVLKLLLVLLVKSSPIDDDDKLRSWTSLMECMGMHCFLEG